MILSFGRAKLLPSRLRTASAYEQKALAYELVMRLHLPNARDSGAPVGEQEIAQAVDEGLDTMIVDLTRVPRVDVNLVQLCVSVAQMCQELSLRYTFACADATSKQFREFEEAKDWTFAGSYEDAVAHAKQGAAVA